MEPQPPWADEYQTEWGLWTIAHGLPDPPEPFTVGMLVPLARWVDDRCAAVLSVSWWEDDEEPPSLRSDVELFTRDDGSFEPEGSGGTGWFEPPFSRPDMPADVVAVGGWLANGPLQAMFGVAGSAVTDVVLRTPRATQVRAIESGVGAWVAAWHRDEPATVELKLGDETVVMTETSGPGV